MIEHTNILNFCWLYIQAFIYLAKKILRGKREEIWTNGPPWPWRPKGVGVGGGCVPSCTKRGMLKRSYMYILGFTESHLSHTLDPIQEAIEFFGATKTYRNVIIL